MSLTPKANPDRRDPKEKWALQGQPDLPVNQGLQANPGLPVNLVLQANEDLRDRHL